MPQTNATELRLRARGDFFLSVREMPSEIFEFRNFNPARSN
jgi:hypothetical protein